MSSQSKHDTRRKSVGHKRGTSISKGDHRTRQGIGWGGPGEQEVRFTFCDDLQALYEHEKRRQAGP